MAHALPAMPTLRGFVIALAGRYAGEKGDGIAFTPSDTCWGVGHDWQYNPFGLGFRILVSSHILSTVMFLLPSALDFSISLTFFPVVLALTTHSPSIIHPYVPIRGHDSACTYPQADDSLGLLMWAQKSICSVHMGGHKVWHLRDHVCRIAIVFFLQTGLHPLDHGPLPYFTAMSNSAVSKLLLPEHCIQWHFLVNNTA